MRNESDRRYIASSLGERERERKKKKKKKKKRGGGGRGEEGGHLESNWLRVIYVGSCEFKKVIARLCKR